MKKQSYQQAAGLLLGLLANTMVPVSNVLPVDPKISNALQGGALVFDLMSPPSSGLLSGFLKGYGASGAVKAVSSFAGIGYLDAFGSTSVHSVAGRQSISPGATIVLD